MVRRNLDMVVGDIGGTQLRVGVSSPERLVAYESMSTPQDPDRFFHVLGGQILRFAEYHKATAGAIAVAGPVRMENQKEQVGPLPNIAGMGEPFDLTERLAAEHPKLRHFPLVPLNDAAAAAHTTARYFAEDRNEQPLTYLSIKTGVGGDTIVDYETYSYTGKALSEYGQMPFMQLDGSYATLEDRVSGKAIQQLYGGGTRSAKQLNETTGTDEIWQAVGQDLARGIGVLIPLIGMKQVIIGGSIAAHAHRRFEWPLAEELQKIRDAWPANIAELPKIQYLPPDLDQIVGLRGCYFAARQRLAA